jgi:signal transduction histidine kinase
MNLFQRFYRSKDVNKIQGTGLGLSIAKEMIKLHNGTISVISKFGVGSTFKIVFPSTIPS